MNLLESIEINEAICDTSVFTNKGVRVHRRYARVHIENEDTHKYLDFSTIEKTASTPAQQFRLEIESAALRHLEEMDVDGVPRLLFVNDNHTEIIITVVNGFELEKDEITIPNELTFLRISLLYVDKMIEIFKHNLLNIDQIHLNTMIDVDHQGIPIGVNLFDIVAEKINQGRIELIEDWTITLPDVQQYSGYELYFKINLNLQHREMKYCYQL